ncbi:hypothetical protein V9T40_011838 [Parthenolecanium corni]|uniref:Autophagy-related protein 9 n=1 Tax=Parthenolecanium corni TaxID=536013 RepID=A0AAN9XYS7_9HEMI
MTNNMEASYRNLVGDPDDSDDHPPENVKIHVPPASAVTRWSHIEDLDLFFSQLYVYHQKQGFRCIFTRGMLALEEVVFMVIFCLFMLNFVDYDILFRNKLPPNHPKNATLDPLYKITIPDSLCSWSLCSSKITGLTWLCVGIVLVYWLFRLIKLVYNLYHFWDIKGFYNIALGIPDDELKNITWNEVQKKICEVQIVHQMCIRKNNLTELDIYHRILRSKNYMVAMINKSILPTHYNIPFVGNVAYFSQGLKFNIELLLFSGTWGLFDNWHLKEDYKKFAKRHELAAKLQSNIAWFAFGNLILGVFVFVWQLVYFFFNNAELLKREPSVLALRQWSLFGRLYLRHFNELDHELDARLRRAYRSASKYMNTFSSPIMVIIAQNLIFQGGAVFIVLVGLTIYDEDVLNVEHVFAIITILGAALAIIRKIIPDENCCWQPENLMTEVLAEVHYLPDAWRGHAHTTFVRDQFSQLFQYKFVYLLYELISPIVVPFILYFKIRPRSLEIIDFYRNFTVAIVGVGDVCSFSLMDMRKHGNAMWQVPGHVKCSENNKQTQAEDGKTELSLIHFAAMNPTWHPPQEAEQFIHEINEKISNPEELSRDVDRDRHSEALESVCLGLSMIASQHAQLQPVASSSKVGFPPAGRPEGLGTTSSYFFNPVFGNSESIYCHSSDADKQPTPDVSAVDMNLKTLYLHSIHHKKLCSDSNVLEQKPSSSKQLSINAYPAAAPSSSKSVTSTNRLSEETPLLKNSPRPT